MSYCSMDFEGKNKIQSKIITFNWLVGWEHYWVKGPQPKSKY